MRIYSPVPQTRRDAIVETVVPLGKPMKGRDGKMIESIVLPKDTPCMLGGSASSLPRSHGRADRFKFMLQRCLMSTRQRKSGVRMLPSSSEPNLQSTILACPDIQLLDTGPKGG